MTGGKTHKILIVEDEDDIRHLLSLNLKGQGYDVDEATDGLSGLEKALSLRPDLVILDLMLPKMTGEELCRRLKADERTKGLLIIMLTAKANLEDIIAGLELGADDYLAKPFSFKELILRIKALLRRGAARPAKAGPPDEPAAILSTGPLTINTATHEVFISGRLIKLTALEFSLLYYLAQRPYRVIDRETLLNNVWGHDDGDTSARTVDTHMRRLRQKLGPEGEQLLVTVRGVGYQYAPGHPSGLAY